MQTMPTLGRKRFLDRVKADVVEPDSRFVVPALSLREMAEQEIEQLSRAGVKPGSMVMLEASSTVKFLVRLLAIIDMGAICIPIDFKSKKSERLRYIESFKPAFFIAEEGLSSFSVPSPALPSDAIMLLMTSGTTGSPKAVIHGTSNIEARLENGRRAIPAEVRRSSICVLPLHFGHGLIGVALQALFDSETLVLVPQDLANPRITSEIGNWVDTYSATFISGTPGTWSYITRLSPPPKGGSLRRAQMASAHATSDLQKRIQHWAKSPFYNCYGMTETATWVSDQLVGESTEPHNVGSGRNWNSEFQILNCDADGIGEVAVKTDSLAYGYLGDWTSLTPRQAVYHTGDIGKLNDEGELLLFGRRNRLINRGGIKVSPEEVEREILALDLTEDVVVFSASDLSGIRVNVDSVIGIIVLKPAKSEMSIGEITKALEQGLMQSISSYKIPNRWLVWEAIPRRSNGKLDIEAIKLKYKTVSP